MFLLCQGNIRCLPVFYNGCVWVIYILCMHETSRHCGFGLCLILTHAWWFWQMCGPPPSKSGISAFIMMYDTKSFHIWQWREAITLQCLSCYPSYHYASLMGSLPHINGLHAVSKQLFYGERYMQKTEFDKKLSWKSETYKRVLIYFERSYSLAPQ